MEVPSELEMLEALPVVSNRIDEQGVFWYDFQNNDQTVLRLSFSLDYRSVQTDVFVADRQIVSVCQEGAVYLRIRPDASGNNMLIGEFGIAVHPVPYVEKWTARVNLTISFFPRIEVKWSTLWDMDYGQFN